MTYPPYVTYTVVLLAKQLLEVGVQGHIAYTCQPRGTLHPIAIGGHLSSNTLIAGVVWFGSILLN